MFAKLEPVLPEIENDLWTSTVTGMSLCVTLSVSRVLRLRCLILVLCVCDMSCLVYAMVHASCAQSLCMLSMNTTNVVYGAYVVRYVYTIMFHGMSLVTERVQVSLCNSVSQLVRICES